MQLIMEPIFEVVYLILVVGWGISIWCQAEGKRQYVLFGMMAIILGCGDAFHLVPRIYYLITTGTTALPEQAALLGFGKLVTSMTMTYFYVMLYQIWQLRYRVRPYTARNLIVYGVAVVRVILCLLPQNDWLSPDAPLMWGVIRNIPLLILGLIMIHYYYQQAVRHNDRDFRGMWLAVTLSFAFYIPVVLFADTMSLVGLLMIPKTCAYLWMVWMGKQAVGS